MGEAAGLWVASLLAVSAAVGAGRPERARHETDRAVVEYDAGVLSPVEADEFGRLVDQGIADIEALVAPGLPEWARRRGRLRYVVSARVGMSRAFRSTVLLPLDRVRSRSAPYLHESTHLLVPFRGSRVWLSEGFASYVESWVSEHRGGYDAHVFTRAGDRGIHAAARAWLERPEGRAVLPWVGAPGEPPGLGRERQRVARPFYVLAQSLTKYIVDAVGIDALVRLVVEGGGPSAFASLTGRSEEQWRREWLDALGQPALADEPPPAVSPTRPLGTRAGR